MMSKIKFYNELKFDREVISQQMVEGRKKK